jgi:hypothetical protein
VPKNPRNTNFYEFNLNDPENVTWKSLTAEQLVPAAPNPTNPPNPPSPFPIPLKSVTNTPSITAASSNEITSNKSVIVGLSVGLGALGIASVITFTLIYRRVKKKNTASNDFGPHEQPVDIGVLQIPPDDRHYLTGPPVNQQYPINPVNQQYPINPVNQQYPINPINQQYLVTITQAPQFLSHNSYYSDYSPTLSSTQSQGYSPGQELPSRQEK